MRSSSAWWPRSRRRSRSPGTASPMWMPSARPTWLGYGRGRRRCPSSWRRPSVPARRAFDYAIVRVVPHVEREEFVNVGVILHCEDDGFLAARIELDEGRLLALAPDVDLETVRGHLAAIPIICA